MSAACGIPKHLASLCHANRSELGDSAAKRTTRQGVQIVEGGDTLGWHPIGFRRQLQLGHDSAPYPGQSRYNHRSNSIRNGVPSQNKNRSVTAWRGRKPDLTALHQPNPTNPLPDPNQRSRQEPSRHQ